MILTFSFPTRSVCHCSYFGSDSLYSKLLQGVKQLLKTPTVKAQKAPKNDLTNVAGVKQLMATPKLQNSPR